MFRTPDRCTLVRGKILPGAVCKWFELDLRFNINIDTSNTTEPVAKRGTEMSGLKMYLPITKVDAVNRLVYGIATEEKPDRSKEIFDYVKSKPYYEEWSADIAKATNGQSLGNLRAMHGRTVAGKVTELHFNDDQKRIEICAKVVDDNEWKKVQEGCYSGFSQGGEYIDRYTDPTDSTLKRYVAKPSEISLVDLPCLPTATFQLVKSIGPASEVEIRPFKSISDEDGVEEALQKFFTEEEGDAASLAAEEATEKAIRELVKGGDLTVNEAREKLGLEKLTHQPGLGTETPGSVTPLSSSNSKIPMDEEGEQGPGGVNSGSQTTNAIIPGTDDAHASPSMESGPGSNPSEKEKESGAHELEPKTREGNPDDSPGGVNSSMGSGAPAGASKSADGDAEGTQAESVRQVWLAKDGKPFSKKADALAHSEEVDRDALVKELTSPADKAIEELTRAMDRVDGGAITIQDMQTYDKVWQLVQSAQSTRVGHQPLGKIYISTDDLPSAIRDHFKDVNKRRQWMHVWNSVFKDSNDEQKAFAQAWAAAEKALLEPDFQKTEAAKKPFGDVVYADPGYQKDGRKRFPLLNERFIKLSWAEIYFLKNISKYTTSQLQDIRSKITAAWKANISPDGPPQPSKLQGADFAEMLGQTVSKHLYDVGQIASHILSLNNLKTDLEYESLREGDDSGLPQELSRSIDSLCTFLRNLVMEETEELMSGTEDLTGEDGEGNNTTIILARAAVGPNASYLAKLFQDTVGDHEEELAQKALKKGQRYNKSKATLLIDALQKVGQKMGQVNRMHLQAAHDHISEVSGGAACDGDMDKAGARISKETHAKLKTIHDHMSDLGADCSMSKGVLLRSTDSEIQEFEKGLGLGEGSLHKIVEENIALKKAQEKILTAVDGLKDRIQKLEKEPEPPRGVKRVLSGVVVVSKEQDGTLQAQENFAYGGERGQSAFDAYAKYLEGLPDDQRTLELIKHAQRSPRRMEVE